MQIFFVVKFVLHLFALANFFSFNSLFLLLTGIVIINIDVLKKIQFNMMNLLFTCSIEKKERMWTVELNPALGQIFNLAGYLLALANFCFSNCLLVAAILNLSRETLQRID